MMISKPREYFLITSRLVVVFVFFLSVGGCISEPDWQSVNENLVREHGIKERHRDDIPETGIVSNLEPGVVTTLKNLLETEIAPGVKGRMYWGSGTLINWMTFEPGTEIPGETLPGERIMVVMKGSIEQMVNGAFVPMEAIEYEIMTPISGNRERHDFVYLEKGVRNAVKAGNEGAELLEVNWPVRLDYMKKAGDSDVPSQIPASSYALTLSVKPNRVYNLHDVQFAEITPKIWTRLISGKGVQVSFLRMDPGSEYDYQNQPEEQLMIVLRGWMDKVILDRKQRMEKGDILYLPVSMVHGGEAGPLGCDVLSVFWPVRPDYYKRMEERRALFHSIIPEDAEIELLADEAKEGPALIYCEGPSWINGKLYFSSMGYDDNWNGNIESSALVEMDPDGTYRYVAQGIETNGTFPLGNGNLAVCDMYGHRVIEMTTGGQVVRVLADSYKGKRLDGPNDIVVDDKGGIYFTDPQIVPPPHMQPGRSVFYIKPDGDIIRVIEPGELIKPNGLILSPDCKTLYVNSTPENLIMLYDVNENGSLSNGRKFSKLFLTPEVLDQESINPQVDGMTVDDRGNVYITSIIGLQIFSPRGDFIGIIHFPLMPVNCCFGNEDGKTLYVTCNDKIYKIRTTVRGAAYTLKR